MQATKANVGTPFRQMDMADEGAVGGKHDDPILTLPTSPAAPEISLNVASDSVRDTRSCTCKQSLVREAFSIVNDIEHMDVCRTFSALDHVEQRLVG